MNADTSRPGRRDSVRVSRLIRGLWNREERHRRRRLAESKQRELWRLLETSWVDVPEKAPNTYSGIL